MIDWPNVTVSSQQEAGLTPEELQRSKCILGFIPVVYYSVLLCVGVPGRLQPNIAGGLQSFAPQFMEAHRLTTPE